jgi:signal transduction histidine kinase
MRREQHFHAMAEGEKAAAAEALRIRSQARMGLREALERTRAKVESTLSEEDKIILLLPIEDRLLGQREQAEEESLYDLIESAGTTMGIEVALTVDVEAPPSGDVVDFLRYVVDVCLDNCKRHGRCSTASISIASGERYIVMSVTDNGVGLPNNFRIQPGHGLAYAAEYAELLGGGLTIATRAEGGVEVRAQCRT